MGPAESPHDSGGRQAAERVNEDTRSVEPASPPLAARVLSADLSLPGRREPMRTTRPQRSSLVKFFLRARPGGGLARPADAHRPAAGEQGP